MKRRWTTTTRSAAARYHILSPPGTTTYQPKNRRTGTIGWHLRRPLLPPTGPSTTSLWRPADLAQVTSAGRRQDSSAVAAQRPAGRGMYVLAGSADRIHGGRTAARCWASSTVGISADPYGQPLRGGGRAGLARSSCAGPAARVRRAA